MNTYTYVEVFVFTDLSMYVSLHIYMYIHIRIYKCVYIYILCVYAFNYGFWDKKQASGHLGEASLPRATAIVPTSRDAPHI